MAKMMGKGGFGKAHGGATSINSKLVNSPMSPKMAPKGGKVSGKR